MLKVLLVDDEPLSIEGLKSVVDWGKLGYEICGVCENGEEAVSLTKKLRPDVIVTDIRMPVMDGLALISHIRNKLHMNIRFIILSGYGEFEYARKAMQFGVKHYLLKPLFEEEMTDVLKELHNEIEQQREAAVPSMEEMHMSMGCIIRKLIHRECDIEEFLSLYKSAFNKSLVRVWYYILIKTLENDNISNYPDQDENIRMESQSRKDPIGNILEDLAKEYDPVIIINHDENSYGLLVGFTDYYEDQREVEGFADALYRHLEGSCNKSFYIAVGTPVIDLAHIINSYNAAHKALSHSFYKNPSSIIFYNTVKDRVFNYGFLENEFINNVIDAIEDACPDKVESSIDAAFSHFNKILLAPEIVIMYVKNIVYRSIKLIQNMDGNKGVFLKELNITGIKNCNISNIELKKILTDYCKDRCKIINELNKKKNDENSYRIEEYVRQNYKNPISIKEMSKSLYITPVYLGQLFKRKFGIRFNEYIHKLRIEEAKRLLEETSMKTCEIAREIGYSNYNLFLQHFEKITGTKPKDYRKV